MLKENNLEEREISLSIKERDNVTPVVGYIEVFKRGSNECIGLIHSDDKGVVKGTIKAPKGTLLRIEVYPAWQFSHRAVYGSNICTHEFRV